MDLSGSIEFLKSFAIFLGIGFGTASIQKILTFKLKDNVQLKYLHIIVELAIVFVSFSYPISVN